VRLALLVLLVPATARAELRVDYELGGGAEAGTIVHKSPPELVAEAGLMLAYRPADSILGVAIDLLVVGRDRSPFDAKEEIHSDLMLLIADPEGRGNVTIGGGIRNLSIPNDEGLATIDVFGYDFARLDIALRLASWSVGHVGRFEVDARGAFTFGCYSDAMAACTSTISTTYVAGVGVAFATAR